MPLNVEDGKHMLQLLTSRYNDRHWRKKIEKTLSLPQSGVSDDFQRTIFVYLKQALKAYKSRRADLDSWIVGGFPTQEAIERAKFKPELVGPSVTKDDVAFLGSDPGLDVDEAWWEDMLVNWFEIPEEEKPEEETLEEEKPEEELAKAHKAGDSKEAGAKKAPSQGQVSGERREAADKTKNTKEAD